MGGFSLLIAANIGAWFWAIIAFQELPMLLGTAGLAFSLGLRHAFDADHIAAIDNVTRKLVQDGKRPIGVGLFFSLGHSTTVVGLSVVVAITTMTLQDQFETYKSVGGIIGTLVSALFLFTIAFANSIVLVSIWRTFRARKNNGRLVDKNFDFTLSNRGLLGWLFRRLSRVIERSWQMYPLGLLFALGFDTSTEVGLLASSATQASQGLSIWSILVFPALFTAGMTLVDTTDSILMLYAYGWALVKPTRKLYYNLTITGVSIMVAVGVGSLEVLNLIGGEFGRPGGGGFWGLIGILNANIGELGYIIVGIFIAWCAASYAVYRINGRDKFQTPAASGLRWDRKRTGDSGPKIGHDKWPHSYPL
ncbi:MAG TPA: HoxN/HupN/NixA family nickel/cobalt transporter [Methylocella sp.]|nr:HoxN/HupN/NixA family nickel/cobalt transporter [Methylocella sp.]